MCVLQGIHTRVVLGTSSASPASVGLPRMDSPAAKSHSSHQSGSADTLAVCASARLIVAVKNGRSAWSLVCVWVMPQKRVVYRRQTCTTDASYCTATAQAGSLAACEKPIRLAAAMQKTSTAQQDMASACLK